MNICYTGGGSGGHIFPIFPIDDLLLKHESSLNRIFIGRISDEERTWVESHGIPYYSIQSGKLRRYHSILNFIDLFRVVVGFFQAIRLLRKEKPSVVFSKGGFVSVPVVIAARILKIPIITHDSDSTPGLANKIAIHFATTMCIAHQEVEEAFLKHLRKKCVVTGVPSRLNKEHHRILHIYKKPLIAIFGGSLGALQINNLITPIIEELSEIAYVVHQTGKGKGEVKSLLNYETHEFIEDEYIDILSQASLVISRSGATSLADYIEMEVPPLLIPLGRNASRGDQIMNAYHLVQKGAAVVLEGENVKPEELLFKIKSLLLDTKKLEDMKKQLINLKRERAETLIATIILDTVR